MILKFIKFFRLKKALNIYEEKKFYFKICFIFSVILISFILLITTSSIFYTQTNGANIGLIAVISLTPLTCILICLLVGFFLHFEKNRIKILYDNVDNQVGTISKKYFQIVKLLFWAIIWERNISKFKTLLVKKMEY